MHYAYLELERYDNIEDEHFYDYYNVSPVEVLQQSYDHCQIDAKREVGEIGIHRHGRLLLLVEREQKSSHDLHAIH